MKALGRRIGVSLALLLALCGVYSAFPNSFALIVGVSLIAVLVVQWGAAIYFNAKAEEPQNRHIVSLRVRAQDGVALAMASTMGALLGAIVVARAMELIPPVDRWVFLIGLSFSLLMLVGPAVNSVVTFTPWKGPIERLRDRVAALFDRVRRG